MKEDTRGAIRLWCAQRTLDVTVIVCLAVLGIGSLWILRQALFFLAFWKEAAALIGGCAVLVLYAFVIRYLVLRIQNKTEGWQLRLAEWLAKKRRRRLIQSVSACDDDMLE
jgi:hypothetical protein